MVRKPREPKVYAEVRKRFPTETLRHFGFVHELSWMVKRGAGRKIVATATSRDGDMWTVRPECRYWKY